MFGLRDISIVIVLLALISNCMSDENVCPILRHPKRVDISNILGTWYAVRGIEHTTVKNTQRQGSNKDCNSMTISLNGQSETTLQWSNNNVVKFQVNSDNPNMWKSTSNSISNVLAMKTLQVTEVDDNHIVITICTAPSQLSSAVLNRQPTFILEKVLNATNILTEQGLKIVETFDRCQNAT